MNAWQFMGGHPFLTWCLAWLLWPAFSLTGAVVNLPFRLWNRWLRHRNIVAHGWPPAHLDADGDFKPEPKVEEKEQAKAA